MSKFKKYRYEDLLEMDPRPAFLNELTETQLEILFNTYYWNGAVVRDVGCVERLIARGLITVLATTPTTRLKLDGSVLNDLNIALSLSGIWVAWNCYRVLEKMNHEYELYELR